MPVKPDVQGELDRADALVARGCYDCLTEARGIYEHAAVAKARPLVISRLFETEILIALREKELAIPESRALADARGLAPELPPAYDAARYLAIADAMSGDSVGVSRSDQAAFIRAHGAEFATYNAWIAALDAGAASLPFRQYLAVSLDCGYLNRTRSTLPPGVKLSALPPNVVAIARSDTTRPPLPAGAPPIVAYRYASCGFGGEATLTSLLDAQPAFVEAGLPLARLMAAQTTYAATTKRRALLEAAYAKFPQSPSATCQMGALFQQIGDCRAALRYYGETLAHVPAHEDALLGQTICLGYLQRHDDAIVSATRMIDLKTYNFDQGYYWRAWNWYQKKDLVKARESSDLAKSMKFDTRVMTLAGVIEHDQDDLDVAEKDLHFALQTDHDACMAQWYLGLVALKRQTWLKTADEFAAAMTCYERAVRQDRELRASMEQSDVDPDFKRAQLAGFDAAIKEDGSQQSAAAYNAAVNYLRADKPDKALEYADLAARDPDRRDKAEALKKLIK
jgi:tetratricopeptide (TPR) repeat protein